MTGTDGAPEQHLGDVAAELLGRLERVRDVAATLPLRGIDYGQHTVEWWRAYTDDPGS